MALGDSFCRELLLENYNYNATLDILPLLKININPLKSMIIVVFR